MPTSRVTTWNPLDILTASALNGEFNAIANNCVSLTGSETLTNKTYTAPIFSGTATGTYTLGGTPTITAPTITTPAISSPVISGAPTTANALGVSTNTLTIGNGTAAIKCLREDGVTTDTDTAAEALADSQAAYTDVDATNAALTFTVNATGKYAVVFNFNGLVTSTSTPRVTLLFRLTDGTNSSNDVVVGGTFAGLQDIKFPVTLFHIFTFGTTGSKTVKLQYKSATTSGANSSVSYNDQTDFASVCSMYAFRIAD